MVNGGCCGVVTKHLGATPHAHIGLGESVTTLRLRLSLLLRLWVGLLRTHVVVFMAAAANRHTGIHATAGAAAHTQSSDVHAHVLNRQRTHRANTDTNTHHDAIHKNSALLMSYLQAINARHP